MKKILLVLVFFSIIKGINAQDEEYKAVNLGSNINTDISELRPLISPDGQILFFIREGHPENTQINDKPDCQDIWYSEKMDDGSWSEAIHMDAPFNTENYNGVFSITPDGNTILIRGAYEDGEFIEAGFSVSHKTADGWSPFQKLIIHNFSQMNLGTYYGGSLSGDGKALIIYMSEQSEGKINDIYASFLKDNGAWTKPKKLSINTTYDELAPFLAPDGRTLYFSSNRPGGYGDNDIYVTHRLDDTWDNWSKPENMGPTINSDDWEAYYSLDATGEYAYMISYKNSLGGGDIVKIKLKEELRPDPVVMIYGNVYNAKTKIPIFAKINYEILPGGTDAGVAQTNPATGEYKIILPYGNMYGFTASTQGFVSVSDNIDITEVSSYKEIKRDLYLSPLEVGQVIRLNNIFFDFNKSTLRAESYSELNRVARMMQDNPGMVIEIAGHTDNIGSDDANMKLSAERANAVREYILSKKIVSTRIKSKGFGKTKPIATNTTEEGRQLNRRVEFVILKK